VSSYTVALDFFISKTSRSAKQQHLSQIEAAAQDRKKLTRVTLQWFSCVIDIYSAGSAEVW